MITDDQLRACMSRCPDVVLWASVLNEAMARFGITTRDREAAFLAQVAHESNDCRRLDENLHYSAARLVAVWPKRFPTIEIARAYEGKPERLADYVYANRLGNGSVESGDGWRYRGRGLLQITGRENYRLTGAALGIDLDAHPEMLAQPFVAAQAAAQFWSSRGLNALADNIAGDDADADFVRITVAINGGRNGLNDRRIRWQRTRAALAA